MQKPQPDICDKALSNGKVGIDEHGNAHGSRQQLMQEPKPLCPKLHHHEADTGDVAARPIDAGDKAAFDRVVAAREDDRDCTGACMATSAELLPPVAAITAT